MYIPLLRAANGVIYKHVYAHRTGWADRYVHIRVGHIIYTQHTPRYIGIRVEFHERFKIGTCISLIKIIIYYCIQPRRILLYIVSSHRDG